MDGFDRFQKSPQLRALLQQLDALFLDASSIRNKIETERLSPAVARFWLTTLRAQLRQIEELAVDIAEELNRIPRPPRDVRDAG